MVHIRLIYGECLEEMDKLIVEGIKVDAIICDPPYGTTNNKNDKVIKHDELWNRLLALRKNKNTPILLFGDGMFLAETMLSNKKMWKYNWIWNKVIPTGHLNANIQPMKDYEEIMVFYEEQCTYNKQMIEGEPEHSRGNVDDESNRSGNNYSSYKYVKGNEGNTLKNPKRIITIPKLHASVVIHSQQKPVELMEYLIKTYTNENDLILDFTMGSGSTILACQNLNRNAIGIDNGYCEKEKSNYYNWKWVDVVHNLMQRKVK